MAKTRSKPGVTSATTSKPKTILKSLPTPVETPPQLTILPKDASPSARIVSIQGSRYFLDPGKGDFYEFTRISAPKSEPRSWLLAPTTSSPSSEEGQEEEQENGYVLQSPNILLATPIDPLFLLLPVLHTESSSTEYLAPSDYISALATKSPHLSTLLLIGEMQEVLESRIEAVCDAMEIGENDKMYALSLPKLVGEIVGNARRMAEKPLPKSMEERFVKGALDVPVLSVRREESDASAGAEGADGESQKSNVSGTTVGSVETAATSVSVLEEGEKENTEIRNLLRLRTALDFLIRRYVPADLARKMEPIIAKSIDWEALDAHLAKIEKLKKEALALRSIGENISRKRALGDEDEGREEIKKRKKEEEAKAKRGVSQGVKKLAKANRSGMKSLASFFGKK